MKYGVDVSFWKDDPFWNQVKNVDFAILGITERRGKDISFEHNYRGCRENGIKVGGYKYSYARNGADSRAEAEYIVDILAGRSFDYPIFLDLEWDDQVNLPKTVLTEIIEEFRKVIERAGYKFGIYCNKFWYENIIPEYAKKYDFWIASIPSNDYGQMVDSLKPTYPNVVCWQYSWNGSVPGIAGFVDMDVYFDESSEENVPPQPPLLSFGSTGDWVKLLQLKLNHIGEELDVDGIFGEKTKEAVIAFQLENELDPDGIVGVKTWAKLFQSTLENKTSAELVQEILLRFWGDDEERRNRLESQGYSYEEIQNEVNKRLE